MGDTSTTEYVNLTEAAAILGVTRKVVMRLVRDGTLTPHRHPLMKRGRQRIPRAEVLALAAQLKR